MAVASKVRRKIGQSIALSCLSFIYKAAGGGEEEMCWREAIRTQLFNFQGPHLQNAFKTCFCLRELKQLYIWLHSGISKEMNQKDKNEEECMLGGGGKPALFTWQHFLQRNGELSKEDNYTPVLCSTLFPPTCFLLVNLWADFWREVAE